VEVLKSSCSRSHVAAEFKCSLTGIFAYPVKIAGRYYAIPSTDKQNIDLNVKLDAIINMLPRPLAAEQLCLAITIERMAC
jgi:hypothetical protein